MSLFVETPEADTGLKMPRRRKIGWSALVLALVSLLVLSLWPSGYLVQQPGPVFNTLGTTTVEDKEVPVLEIEGAPTYETSGALDLLTVQILGNRENPASWMSVIGAWFDRTRTIVSVDDVYPAGVTTKDRDAANQQLMVSSQQEAVAAALRHQGFDVTSNLVVTQIQNGAPADTRLELGDKIISIGGVPMSDLTAVQTAVREHGTDSPLTIVVERDGTQVTEEITPVAATSGANQGKPMIGIATGDVFEFPIDVTIHLESVGGPSAGMMFALGIIDKLTPGELNGGKNVAGTGTIDASGNVGPIGGIRQKMVAAKDSNAEYFLAPASNCDEVVGFVPDGLRVFKTATLDDSLAVLSAISSGGDLDALPTCTASAASSATSAAPGLTPSA